MNILLNGEIIDFSGHTVADLLAERQPALPFAVAVNTAFVPKSNYHGHPLCEGDHVDIVRPVVGG
ncbi:thiamine biosynthesis protein ThiS [Neisseria arctica]|uniref:Thiamine biosynthesis protein ThiS n=1 Tax=Neisseria arctica TaxID=1470200 RepID=A0A0J0YPR2_9NEIS|nr:sulfur carrier protein ThiS [Neisseria arctica]KLT72146.1 thiamine biosynthesis protein ThiS [Neisseria arctica]UOO86834.1 sulfur carrier protein ThiS [Neisseria arctica]